MVKIKSICIAAALAAAGAAATASTRSWNRARPSRRSRRSRSSASWSWATAWRSARTRRSTARIGRTYIGRTYISPMTKIDNLVQIGHNVKVKGYSGLIAQSGIAGPTEIGYGCLIWAQAGISGHIKIADGVQVGPQAGVPQTLDGSVKYVVGAPAESMKDFGARVLLPKLLAKTRAEVKKLKARLDAAHEAK